MESPETTVLLNIDRFLKRVLYCGILQKPLASALLPHAGQPLPLGEKQYVTYGDRRALARRLFRGTFRATLSLALLAATLPFTFATTLTIATHYTNEQRAPLTACFEQYERLHPGTTIVHRQLSYRDFLQTLFMARIGGTPPDIYNLQTVWTAQLVDSGALAAPSKDVSDFVAREYLPQTSHAMTNSGRVWGIPSEVNLYMLVYNKILFARAGLTRPPATWDELVDAAKRISKINRQGQLDTVGFAFGPSTPQAVNPFLASLYSNGKSLFSSDRRATNLASPAALEALEGQVRLFQTRGASYGATPNQFPSGTLGMMIVPNWFKNQLVQALGARFGEVVGVAPIPGGTSWKTLQYGFFWAVDANSRYTAEAWKLLQWLNTAHKAGHRSCDGDMLLGLGALTGNKSDLAASSAELADPFMKPFADALSGGRALPEESIPHVNEIEDLLRNYFERAWMGLLSPRQALSEADSNIRMILRNSE